jgi:hypothetical protein
VTGLAVWGVHLWRVMAGRYGGPPANEPLGSAPLTGGERVTAVLDRSPELLPAFVAYGFQPLTVPVLRRTLARGVTLAAACRYAGVDLAAFLAALNGELRRRGGRAVALTVVEAPAPAPAGAGCSCCEDRRPAGHAAHV